MAVSYDGNDRFIVFDTVMGQNTAQALKDQLADMLVPGGSCTIDAGSVCRVSTAAIQVIIAFLIAARGQRMSVKFSSIAPPIANAFAALGLSDCLPTPARD